ncbi:MAG: type II toxin-antitoxin system VapC family toxin [Candidatus Obscuribacterales bacterium]|nr:type II toxin-antitoxin system VapC family toxin [Candidatus Obscuribacterales bacterium]
MIIDTSAIIAILRNEPEATACAQIIEASTHRRISAVTFVEAAAVLDSSKDPIISRRFDEFIKEAHFLIEPVTDTQARVAREAYKDFSKGSGHPAKLNFGDCFAYALAKVKDEPLLFVGKDFSHTDISPARAGRK